MLEGKCLPFIASLLRATQEAYMRGRPDYPTNVDQWLRDDLGLGHSSIALDLGAGTGKFTQRLRATGASVVAVEPVSAMLGKLTRSAPAAAAKIGTAEDIPLADGTMDSVVCAQSLHWFTTTTALAEIHRVLKVGGVLGLIWNVRDERTDRVASLTTIITPFAGETPRYHKGSWRQLFPTKSFGPFREKHFPHGHTGSPEQVIVDRILSISFEATPSLARKEEVTFPYETVAYSCTKVC